MSYSGSSIVFCVSMLRWWWVPMQFLKAMMASSNGNIFHVTGPLCGEFTGHPWIPLTKASDAVFDVFFDLCLKKRLSKQLLGWWFKTQSYSLWRQCNEKTMFSLVARFQKVDRTNIGPGILCYVFLESVCIWVVIGSLRSFFGSWWRHQMETFFAILTLFEGKPSVTGGFPS